jgi:MOSC domain-containing protein YiiM/N-acetylglutamate synthase-like GNAT family acetyltransferase
MQIQSVNIGQPVPLQWRGRTLTSAILKKSVAGKVGVRRLGLEGDAQADLKVHGGPDKAVYLYPQEHYPVWSNFLGRPLAPGALGENLTSRGFLESDLAIGDVLEVGSAVLQVSEPRLPCQKLAARYQREDLPARFVDEALPGIYFRVLEAGQVEAGDTGRVRTRHPERWTVREVFRLLTHWPGEGDPDALRLATLPELGTGARSSLRERTGLDVDVRTYTVRADAEFPDHARALGSLLEEAGLPTLGFPEDTPSLTLATDPEGRVVAGAAVERWDGAGLLRSVVVTPDYRGRGLGTAVVRSVVRWSPRQGLRSLSLLTDTADAFFLRQGFMEVQRDELPTPLAQSMELREACGDRARSLTMELR